MCPRPARTSWLLIVVGSVATAWASPRIQHDGLGCVAAGEPVAIEARVTGAPDDFTLRVVFRAEAYPQRFVVEMKRAGDRFQAVLPRPAPETTALVYYLEGSEGGSLPRRTEIFRAPVSSEGRCHAEFALDGTLAGTTVRAAGRGPAFPPGFLAEGLRPEAFRAGQTSTTTTSVIGGATTTVSTTSSRPTTTVALGSPLEACFETEPSPPILPVGGSARFDAACSRAGGEPIVAYLWSFNDGGEDAEGPVVTRVYNRAGVFPAELTVRDRAGNESRARRDVRVEEVPRPAPSPGPAPGATTTVPGEADLALAPLSPVPNVPQGAGASYTLTYGNDGPDADPSVTLVAIFEKATAGAAPSAVSTPGCSSAREERALTVTCLIGGMGPGVADSKVLTVSYPLPDTYFVTVTIAGATFDPVPENNRRSFATAVSELLPEDAGR